MLAFDRGFLASLFSTKLPRVLGEWSYGIYMGQTFWLQAIRYFEQRWYPHPDTLIFGQRFAAVMWWAEPALLVLICVAWGGLLAIFVEQPASKWLRSRASGKQRPLEA